MVVYANTGPQLGCRHIQMVLYFLLMTYTYCMRSVLSVAIVAMNDNSTTTNVDVPIYQWDDRSIVLSAFFWGYIIFQIPAAHLAKKFGIKWILICSTTLDSIACLLIPVMAQLIGSKGVMLCRFLQGVGQGFNLPMVNTLLGHWAPPSERSRIGTFAYAGSVFGNIISMPITGFICSSSFGWPFSFYLWGCFGLSWVIIWFFFGSDKPSNHKSITSEEMNYIESSLGQSTEKSHKTPWLDILKSRPAWAVLFANGGVNWGSAILLTQIPTFLDKVLEYDIQNSALLSAAPYLAMWVSSFVFGTLCDISINKKWASRGNARKIFNSIGSFGPAIGLCAMCFFTKDESSLSVITLIFIGSTTSAGFCGWQVNNLDLSPNHSGVLIGLSNGLTSIFSVISPLMVQYVVIDQTNHRQWQIIFIVAAGVYVTTDIFYILFASGRVQSWNEKLDDPEISEVKTQNNNENESKIKEKCAVVDLSKKLTSVNRTKEETIVGKGIDNFAFKSDIVDVPKNKDIRKSLPNIRMSLPNT